MLPINNFYSTSYQIIYVEYDIVYTNQNFFFLDFAIDLSPKEKRNCPSKAIEFS